jgi:peptidyl-prolyl cis-trans isomerase SurA
MQKLNNQQTYSIYKVSGFSPATPKPLKDIRGFVVADYQEALEKTWIASLVSKYKVTVDKGLLTALYK